jgi:hypothetical protein
MQSEGVQETFHQIHAEQNTESDTEEQVVSDEQLQNIKIKI